MNLLELKYIENSKDEVYYEDNERMVFINFKDDQIIIHELETGDETIIDSIPNELKHLEPEEECTLTEVEFYGYKY